MSYNRSCFNLISASCLLSNTAARDSKSLSIDSRGSRSIHLPQVSPRRCGTFPHLTVRAQSAGPPASGLMGSAASARPVVRRWQEPYRFGHHRFPRQFRLSGGTSTFSANKCLGSKFKFCYVFVVASPHPVEHGPRGVRDGLHAQPRVAKGVAEPLLEPPDVAHQTGGRLRRHVNLPGGAG